MENILNWWNFHFPEHVYDLSSLAAGSISCRVMGRDMSMDLLQNIFLGFSEALVPARLMACFFGVLIGTLVGVLPGLGPAAAIALLLPSTFITVPCTAGPQLPFW
jgi:hypothetical protein